MKNFYTLILFLALASSVMAQTPVPDIATLRASAQGGEYTLSNEVILTFQQDFRGQKYIQDGTAAILIDDNDGTITSSYELNDGITGLSGTLGEFGGMLQFVPLADPGAASSTGNTVDIQDVTLADLTNNFEEYESELVRVSDLTFDNEGDVFNVGTVYPISDASGSYNFRTTYYDADYIGTQVPGTVDVVGIPNSRNDGDYFSARSSDDIEGGVIGPTVTDVANISELRAGTLGQLYRLTGEAVLTYQQSFRNQKYIQDNTAAIMIDDNPGNITSTYQINDGITGIVGSLGEFGGMLQFAPTEDPGAASSSGNMVSVQTVTLNDLSSNFEEYEAELVLIDVNFTTTGVLENGMVYPIEDQTGSFNFRATFFDVDYIGMNVPIGGLLVGLPNSRSDGEYFTSRNLDDMELLSSTKNLDLGHTKVFPNPVNDVLNIETDNLEGDFSWLLLDVSGKVLSNGLVNLSSGKVFSLAFANYPAGTYFLQLTEVQTQKRNQIIFIK